MSKTYLFIFISIAFSVFAHGQSLKDSLIAEGNRYFDKSHDFWDISNFDSCFYYTSKSLSSFKKAGSFDDMVKCYNGLSSLSGYQGRFKMQKEYIDSALSYVNNDTITINSAVANYNLAGYLESVHLLEEAENRYTITTQFAKDLQLDSLTLHTLHNNLSHLYFDLKNYKSSIDEIELAINILKDDNNFNFYKVRSLINKANIYSEVDKINEAFDALNTAELISRNHIQDNKFEFEIILERSKIHFKNQNYNECLKTLSLCNVNQVKGQANYLKYLRLLTLSKIKLSIDLDFENEYVDSLNKYPNRNINHLQEYYGEIAIKAANKNINKAVKQNIKTLNEITSTFKKNLLPSNVAYQLAKLNQSAYQLKVASVIDSLYSEKEIDFFCNQLISAAYQLRRISYFSYVKTEWTEKIEELLPSILNLSFHQKISDIVLIEISELIKQRNANDRNALLTKAKESKLFNEIKNIEALIAKYEEFNLSNNNKKQIEENRTVIIGLRNDLRTKIKSYKNKFPDIYDKLYTKEKNHNFRNSKKHIFRRLNSQLPKVKRIPLCV